MTSNLPASLAQFIPTMFHVEAKAALDAYVNQTIASNAERTKEDILRGIVAYVAGHGLGNVETQEQPFNSMGHSIAGGDRGVYHDRYVATFRGKFPKGEREIQNVIDSLPRGTEISREQMKDLKSLFQMGSRSLLLSPMLRELGCRDDGRTGRWTTPVLRIVRTGNF
jgi:hypothetical protein